MQILLAGLIGVLFAAGVYLLLQRSALRMIFGLILLSNAVNLLVFSMGGVGRAAPPLVPAEAALPPEPFANPLPQALVLTAIVIGFGLVAFALTLVYRFFDTLGTTDTARLDEAEAVPEASVNGRNGRVEGPAPECSAATPPPSSVPSSAKPETLP